MSGKKSPIAVLGALKGRCCHFFWVILLITITPSVEAQEATESGSDQSLGPVSQPFDAVPYFRSSKESTGLRLGRIQFHGALSTETAFDSNVLYSNESPKSDLFFRLLPGADVTYQSARIDLFAGYRLSMLRYIETDVQNNTGHRASFTGQYRISRRFRAKLSENFENTSDPADTEVPERLEHKTNNASAELTFKTPGEDLDLTIRYINLYQGYSGDLSALSFYNNKVLVTSRVNVSSHFRFLPKSVATLEMEYGQTNFNQKVTTGPTNSDSTGFSFNAGLTSQFSRKLAASVKAGATFMNFETGEDPKNFSGAAFIAYALNPRFQVSAGYENTTQVSTFTNYHHDHRYDLELKWQLQPKIQATYKGIFSFMNYSAPNPVASGDDRKDFVVQSIASLHYQFKEWLRFRMDHNFTFRDSNATNPADPGIQTADFAKHQVIFAADFYY